MGFTFDKKPTIEIDGKEYICDPTDVNLIEGISEHFPKLLAIGAQMEEMRANLLVKNKSADQIKEQNEAFFAKNRELLTECQGFIHGTLGVEEYNEIFASRRPNSVEHLKLCTYIFNEVMKERAKVLEDYLDLPDNKREDSNAFSEAAGQHSGEKD